MNTKEIQDLVSLELKNNGITCKYNSKGTRTQQNYNGPGKAYEQDVWEVIFSKDNQTETFEYFTGTGLRGKPRASADVLYSLVSDAQLGDDSFDEFCANLGYDTDSRKALDTYLACQSNGRKIRKLLGISVFNTVAKLVSEY